LLKLLEIKIIYISHVDKLPALGENITWHYNAWIIHLSFTEKHVPTNYYSTKGPSSTSTFRLLKSDFYWY